MGDSSNIKDTAEAVKGIVEAVPVYQDVVQPSAKEVGSVLGRTVHMALAPLRTLVWGFEKIEEHCLSSVTDKLKDIPPEKIITPKPHIAIPTIEALRYTGDEPLLRGMFTKLLATSMVSDSAQDAHPAFVETIKNMVPDEARLVSLFNERSNFALIDISKQKKGSKGASIVFTNVSVLGEEASCEYPFQSPAYIDNICRLGLANILSETVLVEEKLYEKIENSPYVLEVKRRIKEMGLNTHIRRKSLFVTAFGRQFCKACL